MDNDLRNEEILISLVQISLFIRLLSIYGSSDSQNFTVEICRGIAVQPTTI